MAPLDVILALLAALTSLTCMVLLFRAYAANGVRLLLWSALCFVCLTANNMLLFVDLAVYPDAELLRGPRLAASLTGVLFLLYGFLREAE